MAKDFLTDEQVDIEIERLKSSPHVALAKREQAIKMRRRQYMYQLRWYEKRGKELEAMGVTLEDLDIDAETEINEFERTSK